MEGVRIGDWIEEQSDWGDVHRNEGWGKKELGWVRRYRIVRSWGHEWGVSYPRLNRYTYQNMSTVVVSKYSTPFYCLHTVCMSVSVCTCTCKWPLFRLCSIAGVDQIIIENEQLLTEKFVLLPSAFFSVHTGSWYPGHIIDNGVPLVCKIIAIHVHRTYCIYTVIVLYQVWYAAKSLVSEIHLIHSYINYSAGMALYMYDWLQLCFSPGGSSAERWMNWWSNWEIQRSTIKIVV